MIELIRHRFILFACCLVCAESRDRIRVSGITRAEICLTIFYPSLTVDSSLMDLGNLVSRKKDFIPAVTKAIKAGWEIPIASDAPSF